MYVDAYLQGVPCASEWGIIIPVIGNRCLVKRIAHEAVPKCSHWGRCSQGSSDNQCLGNVRDKLMKALLTDTFMISKPRYLSNEGNHMQMEAEVEEAIRNRGKTMKKKGKAAVKGKGKAPLMMELPTNATRDQMLMQKVSACALFFWLSVSAQNLSFCKASGFAVFSARKQCCQASGFAVFSARKPCSQSLWICCLGTLFWFLDIQRGDRLSYALLTDPPLSLPCFGSYSFRHVNAGASYARCER
jgi:hypothetical protein